MKTRKLEIVLNLLIVLGIIKCLVFPLFGAVFPEIWLLLMFEEYKKHDPLYAMIRLASVVSFIPSALFIYGFWNLRKFIQTKRQISGLNKFGVSVIAYAVIVPVSAAVQKIILSLHLPKGERIFNFKLSSNDFWTLFVGLLIVYISIHFIENREIKT